MKMNKAISPIRSTNAGADIINPIENCTDDMVPDLEKQSFFQFL